MLAGSHKNAPRSLPRSGVLGLPGSNCSPSHDETSSTTTSVRRNRREFGVATPFRCRKMRPAFCSLGCELVVIENRHSDLRVPRMHRGPGRAAVVAARAVMAVRVGPNSELTVSLNQDLPGTGSGATDFIEVLPTHHADRQRAAQPNALCGRFVLLHENGWPGCALPATLAPIQECRSGSSRPSNRC